METKKTTQGTPIMCVFNMNAIPIHHIVMQIGADKCLPEIKAKQIISAPPNASLFLY